MKERTVDTRPKNNAKNSLSVGFKIKTKSEKMCEQDWTYTKVHSYTHYGKVWTYTHTGP